MARGRHRPETLAGRPDSLLISSYVYVAFSTRTAHRDRAVNQDRKTPVMSLRHGSQYSCRQASYGREPARNFC